MGVGVRGRGAVSRGGLPVVGKHYC
jgi:hypothetical protein